MNGAVRPLPYHYAVTDTLERENPRAFNSLRPIRSPSAASSELDQALLRHAYRLDETGHPEVHDPVQRAASALGIVAPVEVYADEAGQGNNAELLYVPGRAVLLMTGNTLNLLDCRRRVKTDPGTARQGVKIRLPLTSVLLAISKISAIAVRVVVEDVQLVDGTCW